MNLNIKNKRKVFIVILLLAMLALCFIARNDIAFQFSLNKAFYYSEHEEYEKALEEYDRLIAQKPDLYELYVNKAIMLANAERYDEAIAAFMYAETLNNTDPELYYNLSYLYDLIGDADMSQQYLDKGAALEFENSIMEE